MDHSKKTSYLFSIDALRVISIFAVISIHLSIKVLQNLGHEINIAVVPFIINQSTRFAVPLFFLISGFVLALNYKNLSYLDFFKRRALRVVVPFIFWSFVYVVYSDGINFLNDLSFDFFKNILEGKASYHLYFIPTLIIFYLIFPILNFVKKYLSNPIIILVLISIESYLLYLDFYVKTININPNYRIALLSFIMFVMGMIASTYKDKVLEFIEKNLKIVCLLCVMLLLFMLFHIYDLTVKFHTTRFIYNQYHILNYLYTITFGALFFYILETRQLARKTFIALSKLSFFVFFIHVLIQTLIWDNIVVKLIEIFGKNFLGSFWFTPLAIIILSTISFGIAFIFHKIKGVEKITG